MKTKVLYKQIGRIPEDEIASAFHRYYQNYLHANVAHGNETIVRGQDTAMPFDVYIVHDRPVSDKRVSMIKDVMHGFCAGYRAALEASHARRLTV